MLERNISKLYTLKFFMMFLVIMPIIVPYFQSIGIDMRGVYLLQSIFAVTVFICEVPSGYISDLLGRKNTLVLASILKAIGFSLFPLADSFELLAIAEVVLGIAVSLSSGTDTALIYDTMEIVSPTKAPIKILGKSVYFLSLGEGFASLMASILLIVGTGIKDLAIISAFISWIPLFICLTLVEPPRKKMTQGHKENFKYIFESLFKQSRLLKLIMANAVMSFLGTLTAVWMFQKYWEDIGVPIAYFGFLWALTNFTVSIVSKRAHKIEKQIGSVAVIITIGLLPIAGYLGIALVDHVAGVIVCLLFQVCRGLSQVIYSDALNKRVTTDFRATANSIMQMGVRILFVLIGPLFGFLIDQKGMAIATSSMACLYTLVFVFLLIPLLNERSNFIAIKPNL